ncbi:hypothetical protein Rhopal_001135-T1 [Rhodotorula paludigena]|uniref:Uncharacterized protein n=1 Tax=Rhodotorula paludigena TaxID=86838 RepID=A0AAV5GEU3_9BASI|nr:hypothetical protein Rhopal_001135-T1 [Rhodotorula paludigena]
MPWIYAVPIGVGIVAAAAVAVILLEVVPAVLDDLDRERTNRRRRRELVPVAPVAAQASSSSAQVHEGGLGYAVRKRRARQHIVDQTDRFDGDDERVCSSLPVLRTRPAQQANAFVEQDRYQLHPVSQESHHVLGDTSSVVPSDFELGGDASDDDVPLARLSPTRKTFSVVDGDETPKLGEQTRSSGSSTESSPSTTGTEPLIPAPSSPGPVSASGKPSSAARAGLQLDAHDPFSDAAASSSTLFASSSPDSSSSLPQIESRDVTPSVASPSLANETIGGWVLQSPTLSSTSSVRSAGASSTLSEDEDGWAKLSDVEDEWSKSIVKLQRNT